MMIKINFTYDKNYVFDFDEKKLAKTIAKKVFTIEKCPYDFSFEMSLVSKSNIRSINKKERSINKITDVLSFPSIEFSKPANFNKHIMRKNGKNSKPIFDVNIMDIGNRTIFLGDIVICYDRMIDQAKLYGHSVKREYSFLLTHSLLHLLGYDHMYLKDEKKMFKKQDQVLSELNINR